MSGRLNKIGQGRTGRVGQLRNTCKNLVRSALKLCQLFQRKTWLDSRDRTELAKYFASGGGVGVLLIRERCVRWIRKVLKPEMYIGGI